LEVAAPTPLRHDDLHASLESAALP